MICIKKADLLVKLVNASSIEAAVAVLVKYDFTCLGKSLIKLLETYRDIRSWKHI